MAGELSEASQLPSAEPIGEAFRRLIFHDSEIDQLREEVSRLDRALSDRVRSASRLHDRWPLDRTFDLLAGHYGALHEAGGQYWPVIADEELSEELNHLRYRTVPKREVEANKRASLALELVLKSFRTLIEPLRRGEVIARGHALNGSLVQLSAGVWASNLYIDIDAGDLGIPDFAAIKIQAEERSKQLLFEMPEVLPPDPFVPQFRAIEFDWRGPVHSGHPKERKKRTSEKSDSVIQAIHDLRAKGLFSTLASSKSLLSEINRQLKMAGRPSVSNSTVKRCLEEIEDEPEGNVSSNKS